MPEIDKQVRIKKATYSKLQQLVKIVAAERGVPKVSMTDIVAEAVHMYSSGRVK